MAPRVSVLMTCYNAAPFVREAIDSLFTQTFQPLEIVVVNDGSTDDTEGILRSYEGINVVSIPKSPTIGSAANSGLEHCTGEYIIRLDADDIALPNRVERMVAHLDAHPGVAVVASWLKTFGRTNVVGKFPVTPSQIRVALIFGCAVIHIGIRKSIFERLGMAYDPTVRIGEDYDFLIRVSEVADIETIPEVLLMYRRHGTQLTSNFDALGAHNDPFFRRMLRPIGIEPTEEQLRLQRQVGGWAFIDPSDMEKLEDWLAAIIAANRTKPVYIQADLEADIAKRWYEILIRRTPSPALRAKFASSKLLRGHPALRAKAVAHAVRDGRLK